MGKDVSPALFFQVFCPNKRTLMACKYLRFTHAPVNSRSYFNNKRCVFTMKPSRPLVLPPGRRLAPGRRRTLSPAVTADSTQAKGRFVATPRPLALAGTSWPLPRKPCAGGGSALSGTARDRPRTFFCFGSQVNRAWIDLAAPRRVPDEAVISCSVQIHGPRRQ